MLAKGLETTLAGTLEGLYGRQGESDGLAGRARSRVTETFCRQGLELMRMDQFARAVEQLAQACRVTPDCQPARVALAVCMDELGQTEEALDQLSIALQYDGENPAILFGAGLCSEKLSKYDAAAGFYQRVLEAQSDHQAARQRLAAIALMAERVADAIVQYELLRKQEPSDSQVLGTLANLYYRGGRFDDAIATFETVIALEPDNWALVDDEVEVLVRSGHLREAVERLYKLLDQQGPFADLHLRVAEILGEMGQDAEAMRHYLAALEIDPNYLEARISLGAHHISHGRWSDAAEAFLQASEMNDRLLAAYVGIGVCQAAAGRQEEAIGSFQLAGAIEPNSTMLVKEMARMQLKAALAQEFERNLQRQEDAAVSPEPEPQADRDDLLAMQITRHEEQVRSNPGYPDQHYRYGVLLRAQGRLDEAAEQFGQAIAINPHYVDAIIRLGVTQQEQGKADQAIATFKQALELKGQYVDLHYRLAVLYTDRKRLEEAICHMEKAVGLAPGSNSIRASLALSFQNMGLMDRAAATWRSLERLHVKAAKKKDRA